MSFAALRRLRRRFGVPNAAKIAEAKRYFHDELADRAGASTHSSLRAKVTSLIHSTGFDSKFGREIQWAMALVDRSKTASDPTDDDVERFFDAIERLYGSELSEPIEPRELVGKVVGDRYKIEGVIGEGAAGVVYKARHVETDAPVAIKVLHPSKVLRREIIGELEHPRKFWDELVARFRREARAAANVSHPGIVSVFDFGAEGTGFYQAMEYLSGETLRDTISREAPMPAARAVKIVHEAAAALDAAHARGVVHRDLKPANLFLCHNDWGESVKVLDFGIAKMVREAEEEATRLTETGVFLGTYRYASPEQCLGERVTPASDVYSLAVILFEMLAGRPPFDGPSSVLAIRHATAPAPRLEELRSGLPEGLADVVARALDKRPGRRPSRGGELATALAPFVPTSASAAAAPAPAAQRRAIPADAFAAPRTEARPEPVRHEPVRHEPVRHDPTSLGRTRMTHAASATNHPQPNAIARGSRAFAELLVDEIVSYFPDHIQRGRASNDIYRRLRDEIELRWSLYARSFGDEQVDHFFELLVERVAGGDPNRFGPGFPETTEQRRRRRKRG
jgi:serine/threonine-protein kinase